MNGHRPPPSPESGSDVDTEAALQAALGDVESQGLLDRDRLHEEEEAEDDMQEEEEEEEEELHSRAPLQSSRTGTTHASTTRTNRGRFDRYQGHQHTHQQVAYQQRKRMKGSGGVWDQSQYGGIAAGSSFTGAYGGVRGGAFGGFAGGQSWNNLGVNMARSHATNMHIIHKEVQLSNPPRMHRGCPRPLYYWSEEEKRGYIVLSTSCYHNGYKFPRFTGMYGTGLDGKKETVRYGGSEGCIFKYDFLSDLWSKYRKYQSHSIPSKNTLEFKPFNHGMNIRPNRHRSNELWIFGGNNRVFAHFSLERGEFSEKIYDVSTHDEMHWLYPTSLLIGDEIHIFGRCPNSRYKRHSLHSVFYPDKLQISRTVFDKECTAVDREAIRAVLSKKKQDKNKEKEKEKDKEQEQEAKNTEKETKETLSATDDLKEAEIDKLMPNLFCCKVIYVKHLKQVLVFNGQNGNIYIWRYSFLTQKWNIFDDDGEVIHLPKQHDNNFDVALLHDSIIVMCYNSSKEIWTYNLGGLMKETGKNNHKWSRKNCKDLSGITDDGYMVNVNNEAIHFISFICPTHCSVWVYHLMPKRIIKRVYAPMLVQNVLRSRMDLPMSEKQMKEIQNIVNVVVNHCCIVFYW